MNKDFTFDALKGNARVVDLEELLRTQKRTLREWVQPYYDQKTQDWAVLGYEDDYFLHIEPDWPAGKKRTLHSKYQEHTKRIAELSRIQSKLFDLAFPGWEDEFATFSLEPVVVKRKESKNDPS